MAWRQTCDKPSPELMITHFTAAYMNHQAMQKRHSNKSLKNALITTIDALSYHFDGLLQKRHNSSALAMEFHLFCIEQLFCSFDHRNFHWKSSELQHEPLTTKASLRTTSKKFLIFIFSSFVKQEVVSYKK